MNFPTEVSPDTQLILDELRKLSALQSELFADLAVTISRAAAPSAAAVSRAVAPYTAAVSPVPAPSIDADNWGGLFDGGDDSVEQQYEARIVADNWGGLFEQPADDPEERDLGLGLSSIDGFGSAQIRNEHGSDVVFTGLASADQICNDNCFSSTDEYALGDAGQKLILPLPRGSELVCLGSVLESDLAFADAVNAAAIDTASSDSAPNAISTAVLVEIEPEQSLPEEYPHQIHGEKVLPPIGGYDGSGYLVARAEQGKRAAVVSTEGSLLDCLSPVKWALHATPLGGYDGSLDDDPESSVVHFDAALDRAVGRALAAAAAFRADAVSAAGGGRLAWVMAAGSAQTSCSTICPADHNSLVAVHIDVPGKVGMLCCVFLLPAFFARGAEVADLSRKLDFNGALHCFEYSVPTTAFLAELRGGTCATGRSDFLDTAVRRANHFHNNDFANKLGVQEADLYVKLMGCARYGDTSNQLVIGCKACLDAHLVIDKMPRRYSTSVYPSGSNEVVSLGPISVVQEGPEVFDEMAKHIPEILWPPPMHISNMQSYFWLPFSCSWDAELYRQHKPWPPPTDLQLGSCDAGHSPLPWPSFIMVGGDSVTDHSGRLWKPPWYVSIQRLSKLKIVNHGRDTKTFLEMSKHVARVVPWEYMLITRLVVVGMPDLLGLRPIPWSFFGDFEVEYGFSNATSRLLIASELLETRISWVGSLHSSAIAQTEPHMLHSISSCCIPCGLVQPIKLLHLMLPWTSNFFLVLLCVRATDASLLLVCCARRVNKHLMLPEHKVVEVTLVDMKVIRHTLRSLAMFFLWQHRQALNYGALAIPSGSQILLSVSMASCTLIHEQVQRKCGGLICSQSWLTPAHGQFVQMKPFCDISTVLLHHMLLQPSVLQQHIIGEISHQHVSLSFSDGVDQWDSQWPSFRCSGADKESRLILTGQSLWLLQLQFYHLLVADP